MVESPPRRNEKQGILSIQDATLDDVASMAHIYAESFPDSAWARLGNSTSARFLRAIIGNSGHRILVAKKGPRVVGFVILHINRRTPKGRKWLLKVGHRVALLPLKAPTYVMERIRSGVGGHIHNIKKRISGSPSSINLGPIDESAFLDFIATHSSARGGGIGMSLVEACVKAAQEAHKCRLYLHVSCKNQAAIRLYEKSGFSVHSKDIYRNTMIMSYDILESTNMSSLHPCPPEV